MQKSLIKLKKAIERELNEINQSKVVKRFEQRKAFLKLQAAYLQLEEGLEKLNKGYDKDTANKQAIGLTGT